MAHHQKIEDMKQKRYKILSLLGLFLFAQLVIAGQHEENRLKTVSYAVNEQTSIELNNQYGEVQIIAWDKDSIKVEANTIVTSDKIVELAKLLSMVEVVSRGTEASVVVSTEWSSGNGFLRKSTMDFKNIINSDKKLTVNYKVYLPSKCRLNISNRFGDIYLPDYEGPLRINLSHGDLRARDIRDARKIEVRYGKVLIKSVKSGLLKIDFGSLILDKAENVTLESKSSDIEITEVDRLAIRSKNDELRVDQVKALRGESTLSHLRIKNVIEAVDLTTSYGDVSLKYIKKDFKSIRLNGNSTDYDLDFESDASYQFSVRILGNKTFSYPPEASLTQEDWQKNNILYTGHLTDKESKSKVNIELKNGYVNLYKL